MIGIGKWDLLRPGLTAWEITTGLDLNMQLDFVSNTMKLVAYDPMTKDVKEAHLFTLGELDDGVDELLLPVRFKAAISEVTAP